MKEEAAEHIGVKVAEGCIVEMCAVESGAKDHRIFTTVADNQTRACFRFYLGAEKGDGWKFLETIEMDGVPPSRAGEPSIHLFLEVSEKNNVNVRIQCSDVTIRRWIMAATAPGAEGELARESAEAPDSAYGYTSAEYPDTKTPGENGVSKKKKRKKYGYVMIVCTLLIVLGAAMLRFGMGGDQWFDLPFDIPVKKTQAIVSEIKNLIWERIKPRQPGEDKASTVHESSTGSQKKVTGSREVESKVFHNPGKGKTKESMHMSSDTKENKSGRRKKPAQQSAFTENKRHPVVYRITWGDTLWEITEKYYGNRYLYPYLAKKNSISDPDYIISGDKLMLPEKIGSRKRTTDAHQD